MAVSSLMVRLFQLLQPRRLTAVPDGLIQMVLRRYRSQEKTRPAAFIEIAFSLAAEPYQLSETVPHAVVEMIMLPLPAEGARNIALQSGAVRGIYHPVPLVQRTARTGNHGRYFLNILGKTKLFFHKGIVLIALARTVSEMVQHLLTKLTGVPKTIHRPFFHPVHADVRSLIKTSRLLPTATHFCGKYGLFYIRTRRATRRVPPLSLSAFFIMKDISDSTCPQRAGKHDARGLFQTPPDGSQPLPRRKEAPAPPPKLRPSHARQRSGTAAFRLL